MDDRLKVYDEKMNKSIHNLMSELDTIRAGRANPNILSKIKVDYYGTPTPLNQMAGINVPEARVLQIQPWDVSSVKAIEKALLSSEIGITPSSDGKIIRLVFPELTAERRKELSKDVKKKGEEAKVAIRNIRRDGIDHIKKLSKEDVSEDIIKDLEDEIQKMTDKFIEEVDKHIDVKSKEIMTV